MRNADCCVVFSQQLAQSLVDQRFGLGVKSTRSFVQDKNVGLLNKCTCNGNTLLLATRELGATCTDVSFETIRLHSVSFDIYLVSKHLRNR